MCKTPIIFILLSASLFGISLPLAKLLVKDMNPIVLAGLLYLGAFVGLFLYSLIRDKSIFGASKNSAQLEKKDYIWLAGATLFGGIVAPISMTTGLIFVSGFSASLLLNLEGLATALIATLFFKENGGKRLWLALICMSVAGIFLTWDSSQGRFNIVGPLLLLFAMICWGIDNNLTRHISNKDPIQIAKIKSLIAGATSLALALILGKRLSRDFTIVFALIVGSFGYGASLVFFIKALKGLGCSRAGVFFSFAPFIGALASLIILREWIGWVMFPAIALMIIGVWLVGSEEHSHPHTHKQDNAEIIHNHAHWPDTDHRHEH